jgi:nucleoside-diphosphate-sugar epimerase
MQVFVTGENGFIGGAVAAILIAAGAQNQNVPVAVEIGRQASITSGH